MMKRFLVVLLVPGLITVFSTTLFALDVKFSGEYYAAGMYLDKTSLTKDTTGGNPSTAFYFQRLRVRTDFIVSPGLILVTRFDAMERAWGAGRSATGTTLAADSAGTPAENENIAFDWVYIDYKSPIGIFDVGIMNDGSTGTIFGNSYGPKGRIKYSYTFAPVTINLAYTKEKELNRTAVNNAVNTSDRDNDKYGIEGVYRWKTGTAGLNVNYYDQRENRTAVNPYTSTYFLVTPYVMAKIGPVALQAEFNWATGKDKYENGTPDVTLENYSGWIDATADFKMAYVGASIAYISGDDPGTSDKKEGGIINGGRDWNPCLIMFNYYDRTYWAGNLNGYNNTSANGPMNNAWFFQGRAGVRPIDKLDIMASVSYANADRKPAGVLNNAYGYEADVTATYKITNNLSYMLGAGYFFAGDFYKGTSDTNSLTDDYMVVNKLTLTF